MAEALGAEPGAFLRGWLDSYSQRATGVYRSPDDYMAYLSQRLGRQPAPDKIAAAVRIRMDFARRSMVCRHDAEVTLGKLRSVGLKIGLVSNCTMEIPKLWRELPIAHSVDATVFSSEVGVLKPDPEIYNLATRRLGVEPAGCLYVGDGDSDELNGAAKVGMQPVLIRIPQPQANVGQWAGPTIDDLAEVVALAR